MSSKHTLVLVPLRDRESDWQSLKRVLHNRPPAGRGRLTIWAAEQLPGLPFNRGALLNAGFSDAMKTHPDIDEVLIHDVDTHPNSTMSYGEKPPTCGVVVHHFGQPDSLGGVWSTDPKTYSRMGGHPRGFWGWGYEDSVMEARANAVRVPIQKHVDGGKSLFQSGTHLRDRAGSEGRFQEAKGIMGLDGALLRQEILRDGVQTQKFTRIQTDIDASGAIQAVRVLYQLHTPPASIQPILLLPAANEVNETLVKQLSFGARLYGWKPLFAHQSDVSIRSGVPLIVLGQQNSRSFRPDALLLHYNNTRRHKGLEGQTPLGGVKSGALRDFAALASWVSKSTTVLTGTTVPQNTTTVLTLPSSLNEDDEDDEGETMVWPDDWRIPLLLGSTAETETISPRSGGTTTSQKRSKFESVMLATMFTLTLFILALAVWAVVK